jgi:hypothetical protein
MQYTTLGSLSMWVLQRYAAEEEALARDTEVRAMNKVSVPPNAPDTSRVGCRPDTPASCGL